MTRAAWVLPVLLSAACVDTNLTSPAAGSGAEGYVYFASNREDQNYEIYRMPASGGQAERLTFDPEHNDHDPVPSRDGRMIAWERVVATPAEGVTSTELWVMNADGSNPRVVVRNGASNVSPSWTADDAALVFSSDVGGDWDIYRVSLDGGQPIDLTNNPYADQAPRVSPDGSRILFQSNRTLDFEIYSMAIDGTDVRNLSQNSADDRFPNWSPDGRTIFWTRYVDSFDIWRMNADGTGQQPVLTGPFNDMSPAVSPDGSAIVFTSDRAAPSSLFVFSLAGGPPRQLTNLPGWAIGTDVEPVWTR
jgi:Tol biopolymer transport system component